MGEHLCELRDTFYCGRRHLKYHFGNLFKEVCRALKIDVIANKLVDMISRASN